MLELGERERLDEVGGGLELERLGLGGKDACEEDGQAQRAQTTGQGEPVTVSGLDHRGIDVGRPAAVRLGEHNLVTRTSDDVFEERADIGVGLDDQNPCHVRIMSPGAGIGSAREYEYGVSESARILVVDDEEDIRSLLRELLQRAGYRVEEAPDGRAALRRLSETQPALVLLDVSMPELDGYQTLARIRDLSDVPVIMLTARTQELERVRGLASGADDYVSKPFGRQELLARIQALLRRSGGKAEVTESYRDGFVRSTTSSGASGHEREVTLTPLEFKLLSAFVQHPIRCSRGSSCSSSSGATRTASRATR